MRKSCLEWRAERHRLEPRPIARAVALPAARSVGRGLGLALSVAAALGAAGPALADEASFLSPEYVEFFGSAEFEGAFFLEEAAFPQQDRHSGSFAFEPTLLAEWLDGDLALTLTPFVRLDIADQRRTHFDFREAKIDWRLGDWEVTAGADFVFWGRTEAQQLVDIINSVDAVEDIDEEDKLGQPMLRVTRLTGVGAFSAFYLPFHRQQTFPGVEGRLRAPIQVNEGDVEYLNDGDEFGPSFALRWAHAIGDFDLGLHSFYGISRDPALEVFQVDGVGAPTALRPVYDNIFQVGLDGQFTSGPALWKLEAIHRLDQLDRNFERQDYVGVTAGLEYTLFGIFESNADLGIIIEGSYDSRGDAALTPFNEDAIGGLRLALNDEDDTALLATAAVDVESGATILRFEAERRIAEGLKAEIEANAFLGLDDTDIEASFADDSFIRFKLTHFF